MSLPTGEPWRAPCEVKLADTLECDRTDEPPALAAAGQGCLYELDLLDHGLASTREVQADVWIASAVDHRTIADTGSARPGEATRRVRILT